MRAIRPKLRSHAREHIVTIDTDSAPRIMFYGENFMIEDLPVGTRVIYPKRPMTRGRQPDGGDPLRAQPPRGHRAAARDAPARA